MYVQQFQHEYKCIACHKIYRKTQCAVRSRPVRTLAAGESCVLPHSAKALDRYVVRVNLLPVLVDLETWELGKVPGCRHSWDLGRGVGGQAQGSCLEIPAPAAEVCGCCASLLGAEIEGRYDAKEVVCDEPAVFRWSKFGVKLSERMLHQQPTRPTLSFRLLGAPSLLRDVWQFRAGRAFTLGAAFVPVGRG